MNKVLDLFSRLRLRYQEGRNNLRDSAHGQILRPKWLWFEATDRCNSRCTHCHIWEKKEPSRVLNLNELRKVFSDPLFKDLETIINSGGEALLRPDIVELIRMEHELFPHASLDLSTNGIMPERALEVVETVLKEGIKINVGVSLDGIGDGHDRIRGVPGNFERADRLLKGLVDLRVKYPELLSMVIGLTLSDLTIDHWKEVKEYADRAGIEFMMQWFNQSSFYDNNETATDANQDKYLAAVSAQPRTMIREKWLRLLKGQSISFRCWAGQTFFVLKCDGTAVPCLTYWDDVMGNVIETSPSKIWESVSAVQVREKVGHCQGCLNSWGVEWSASTTFFPRLWFYMRNPLAIIDRWNRKN